MSGSGRTRKGRAAENGAVVAAPIPKRGVRRWTLAIILSGLMIVAVVAAFAVVGISQSTPFSFTIHKSGTGEGNVTHNVLFSHTGTIVFKWATQDGVAVTFSVRVEGSVTPLYSIAGTGANVSISVQGGTTYSFAIQDIYPATASVNGNLEFFGPILTL